MPDGEYVEMTAADLAHRWREESLPEYVDQAVAQSREDTEYATAESALRHLLALAWNDLVYARERAMNRRWSVECDWHVARIVGLTRLVGPLPWGHVNVDLIVDGTYERVHGAMGVPTPLSEADRAQAQEVKNSRF